MEKKENKTSEKNDKKMEEKESVVIDDFDFSLIADFFKRVDRQGPLFPSPSSSIMYRWMEVMLLDSWSCCK